MRPLGLLLALLLLGPSLGFFAPAPRAARSFSPFQRRFGRRGAKVRKSVVAVAAVEEYVEINAFELTDMIRDATAAGHSFIKSASDPTSRGSALTLISQLIEPLDLLMIFSCSYLARKDRLLRRLPRREPLFENSIWFAIAPMTRSVSMIIWPLFYISDCICTLLRAAGVLVPAQLHKVVNIEMSFGYAYAAGRLLVALKSFLVHRVTKPEKIGRAKVLDRLGDIVCWLFVAVWLLEKISAVLGFSLGSILALGGGGAVVLGLACQSPLENLVSGVLIGATNPFGVGDEVSLEEGEGYIKQVGWYQTQLRGRDGEVRNVPNSVFASTTTINFSRATTHRLEVRSRAARRV